MTSYQIPRLPLAVFSGYLGCVAGTYLNFRQPAKVLHDAVVRTVDRGAGKREGAGGAQDWDALSKGVFLIGSVLLLGAMAVGLEERDANPSRRDIDPLKLNRGPPPSYRPTLAEGDSQCCAICLSNARDTFIEDCAHLVMCWDCFEQLHDKKCPACMVPITAATYVYSP